MSDGLIWSGIGQGIANAGSTIGNFLYKDIAAQEDRDARAALLRERLEDKQQARQDKADLTLQLAEMKGGGGGGKGGANLKPEDYAPGGKLAGMLAGKMGMTEPEYAQFYSARKSGDVSKFAQEVSQFEREPIVAGESDAVSRSTATLKENKITRLPPGFEQEFRSKVKALSDLEESYALGGHYDDVTKGRQTSFQTGVGQGILNKEITGKDIGTASQAVASSTGKESYAVQGGEKLNQFTGASETTPKGLSEIQENKAQAGKASSGGTKTPRVQSTKEDADGNMILIMSDGTTKPMMGEDGKAVRSAAFNKEVSKLITKMAEDDSAFKKLPAAEQRAKAEERLTGRAGSTAPAADTGLKAKVEAGGQKYEPSKYEYRVNSDGSVQRRLK